MSSSSSQTFPFFRKMPHLAERTSKQHRHTHSSSTLNIVMMCVQKNVWINTHRHTSWTWQRVLYNPSSHLELVFVPVCLPDVLHLQILDSCCVALKQKINQNVDLSSPLLVSPLLLTAAQFDCLFFFPYLTPMSIRWGWLGWQREDRSICGLRTWGLKTICCWHHPLKTRAER